MENKENRVEEEITQKISNIDENDELRNVQNKKDDNIFKIIIQHFFEFIVSIKAVILIYLIFMIKILLKDNVGNNIWDVVIVTIILIILKFLDIKCKEFEFKSKQDQFVYDQIKNMSNQDKKEIIKELIEK